MKLRVLSLSLLLAAFVVVLTSCTRDHLYYATSDMATVLVETDWTTSGVHPNGVSVFAYDANDVSDMRMGWTDTTDSTDEASSTGSDTFRTENEDLPQTADPTGQWLTGRTTSTSTPGTKDTVTRHSTVRHDTQDMLMSEEFSKLMDTMRDPLQAYTEEFKDLFANRWG